MSALPEHDSITIVQCKAERKRISSCACRHSRNDYMLMASISTYVYEYVFSRRLTRVAKRFSTNVGELPVNISTLHHSHGTAGPPPLMPCCFCDRWETDWIHPHLHSLYFQSLVDILVNRAELIGAERRMMMVRHRHMVH